MAQKQAGLYFLHKSMNEEAYEQKFLNDPDGTGIKTKNCDKVHFLKVYLSMY